MKYKWNIKEDIENAYQQRLLTSYAKGWKYFEVDLCVKESRKRQMDTEEQRSFPISNSTSHV